MRRIIQSIDGVINSSELEIDLLSSASLCLGLHKPYDIPKVKKGKEEIDKFNIDLKQWIEGRAGDSERS